MDSFWNISVAETSAGRSHDTAVTENNQRNRFLFGHTADPVMVLRLDDLQILDVNPAACEQFGYSLRRFKGMHLDGMVKKPSQLKRAIKHRSAILTEVICVDNNKLPFTSSLYFSFFEYGSDMLALVLFRDIIDTNKAEKEKEKRETLALEVAKTESAFFLGEESERQRLARELHGHIGPMMVSVKMGLEQLKSRFAKDNTHYTSEIQQLLDKQVQAIKELRIATSRLAEGYLYQEDITKAIENLLHKYSDFSDIRIYYKIDKLPGRLPVALRYHLFRIIEESLTNAVMHSNASKISLRIRIRNNTLYLYVLDNGQGIKRPVLEKDRGLWLMEQRAALLNGTLHIETVPDKFFRVSLEIPL